MSAHVIDDSTRHDIVLCKHYQQVWNGRQAGRQDMPHNVRFVNTGQKLTKKIADLLLSIWPRCSHDRHFCLLLVLCVLLPAESTARELVTANQTVASPMQALRNLVFLVAQAIPGGFFFLRSRWAARWRLRRTLHAPMTLPEPYAQKVSLACAPRLLLSGLSSGTSTHRTVSE